MKMISLFLAVALGASGCSMLTKSGRQQRAYEKYVRKSSIGRVKQQSRFHSDKPPMPMTTAPSEPTLNSGESSGPEAMSEGASPP